MIGSAASFHQIPVRQTGWNRYAGIGFVALLHAAAIWVLVNAVMLKSASPPAPTTFETPLIKSTPTKPQSLPLPPPVVISRQIPLPSIPVPFVETTRDTSATSITATTQTQQPTHPQVTPSLPDVAATGVMATHTTPPYPEMAMRLGREGTVILSLLVGVDGAVSDAQVVTSSGAAELDQAAVDWVKAHWRYRPAQSSGVAVASTVRAAVKFDLRQAQ